MSMIVVADKAEELLITSTDSCREEGLQDIVCTTSEKVIQMQRTFKPW